MPHGAHWQSRLKRTEGDTRMVKFKLRFGRAIVRWGDFTMLVWPTGEGLIQMRTQFCPPVPAVIAGIGLVIHPATVGTRLRGESQECLGWPRWWLYTD